MPQRTTHAIASVQTQREAAEIRRFGVTECTRPDTGVERFDSAASDKKENLLKMQSMKKQCNKGNTGRVVK